MGKGRWKARHPPFPCVSPFLLSSEFIPFELPFEASVELQLPFETFLCLISPVESIPNPHSTRVYPRPSRPPSCHFSRITPCPQHTSVPTKGVTLQLCSPPRRRRPLTPATLESTCSVQQYSTCNGSKPLPHLPEMRCWASYFRCYPSVRPFLFGEHSMALYSYRSVSGTAISAWVHRVHR